MAQMAEGPKSESPSVRFEQISGSGPINLVGLHGFGGASDAFAEVASRLPEVASWSADLFGHRRQPWPDEVTDFASAVDRIASAIDAVPGPRYLVGYSMGGRLGLAAWARSPERFVGGTLVGAHPGLRTQAQRAERRALDRERAQRLRAVGVSAFFEDWDRSPLFSGRRAASQPWRSEHTLDLARAFETLSLAGQPDLGSFLEGMVTRGRARVVVGERDEKFRRLLARWHPGVLPGGHDLLTESPHLLARAVREHLRTAAIRERASASRCRQTETQTETRETENQSPQ